VNRSVRGKAILQIIHAHLRDGASIEIDGLGSFKLDSSDQVTFEPNGRVRVFLAYAEEDRAEVKRLFEALQKAGFEPWMDREKLLPGQNWPRAIERAIDLSAFFIGCLLQALRCETRSLPMRAGVCPKRGLPRSLRGDFLLTDSLE
jgi:TIR domain